MSLTTLHETEALAPRAGLAPARSLSRRPRPRQSAGTLSRCGLSLVAGWLHAVGWVFPGAWYAAWPAQAALIALGAVTTPAKAFAYGSASGAIGIAASFYWGVDALRQTFDATPAIAWTVFALLVGLEALGFGLFCAAVSYLRRGGTAWMTLVPATWVAIEHWYPRVFPWKLGYSQLECLPLLQIAELAGPTSIGFVMTAVAAAPIVLLLGYRRRAAPAGRRWAIGCCTGAGLLLGLTLIFGAVRARQWDAWSKQSPKLRLALVQVDPAYVGSEQKLRERSLSVHEHVDLLIWPESALGTYSDQLTHFRDPARTEDLSRQSRDYLEPAKGFACHLLAGGRLYREGAALDGPYAMTAFLIGPGHDIAGRYRKRTLLPFGEYIPGQLWFPALREWTTVRELVEAGTNPAPLTTSSGQKLGVVICYEDTLPAAGRETVAAGAEALVSLIQGTAFENPLTLVQHQRLAALRAVENRRYFVRCSSTGMTCVVAPSGKIVAQLPAQTEGTLVCDIGLVRQRTLYNFAGDWFPWTCTVVAVFGLIFIRQRNTAVNSLVFA